MTPFDNIDQNKLIEDEAYFRGSVVTQLCYLHSNINEMKNSVSELSNWKLQMVTLGSAVACIVTLTFKFLFP